MTTTFTASHPAPLRLSILSASLIAAALLTTACGGDNKGPGAQTALEARIVEVAPRSAPIVIEVVGQVEGSKEVEVRARVSGILKKRLYGEGEIVRAGAELFQIDPEPFDIAPAAGQVATRPGSRPQRTVRGAMRRDWKAWLPSAPSAARNGRTPCPRPSSPTPPSNRPRRACATPN